MGTRLGSNPLTTLALGGGVLLLLALFLPWYGVEGVSETASGWESFDLWDIILALLAGAAISFGAGRLPLGPEALIGIGGLATLYILFRMINDPFDSDVVGLRWGIFVALLAALAILGAGVLGRRTTTT